MVAAGLAIPGASAASASSTWVQQVGRTSADAPCDIPAVEGDAAGWSDWTRTWAQWPHGGDGGWVCSRSITWAFDSAPVVDSGPVVNCVSLGGWYVDFGSGWTSAFGSPWFSDSSCTVISISSSSFNLVLAAGEAEAESRCLSAFAYSGMVSQWGSSDVWGCYPSF